MRRFTERQRRAIESVDDRCGEIDHITPYSLGGKTTMENAQVLDPKVNRAKGAFHFEPRGWQQGFIDKWNSRAEGKPFMLIAVPGGGKTMAALKVASDWLRVTRDRKLVVVVPSVNLREQWRDEACKFGVQLETETVRGHWGREYNGYALTYHSVANGYYNLQTLCARADTMVVLDEIHHCGESKSFGDAVLAAFSPAKERLLLSGTPWRSCQTRIPYVKYDENQFARGDFTYSYRQATADRVVRKIVFDHSVAILNNESQGWTQALNSQRSDEEASGLLYNALNAKGEFVRKQIARANERLTELRRTTPDAAAMAVCIDTVHAEQVANVIRQVTGCEPSVIVSDTSKENDTIASFRKSKKPWLVSIKKVSEGTDIKRLQVLCYLTNITSDLFFRQIVGRVSRVRHKKDSEGYVYLPSDPRLIRCAQTIEDEQVLGLKDRAEDENRRREVNRDSITAAVTQDLFSTEHGGTELVLIDGVSVELELARQYQLAASASGQPLHVVKAIAEALQFASVVPSESETVPEQKSVEAEKRELRTKISKMVNRVASKEKRKSKEVHLELNKALSIRRTDLATKEELQAKLHAAERMYRA